MPLTSRVFSRWREAVTNSWWFSPVSRVSTREPGCAEQRLGDPLHGEGGEGARLVVEGGLSQGIRRGRDGAVQAVGISLNGNVEVVLQSPEIPPSEPHHDVRLAKLLDVDLVDFCCRGPRVGTDRYRYVRSSAWGLFAETPLPSQCWQIPLS